MRRGGSRSSAAYGLSFDHVRPGPLSPACSHESWNTSFGTGTAALPVSMRISSDVGSALRSPHRIGGDVRRVHSSPKPAGKGARAWRGWGLVDPPVWGGAETPAGARGPPPPPATT